MNASAEIILIACFVALAAAIPGVFLVLRKMSLMSDAISHSVLLGIVLVFFLVKDLHSPLLLLGAALTGVLTVMLTEALISTKKVKEDAAIGMVFPVLFALAVILITMFASDVHLDTDAVLLGELAFAPFERVAFHGHDLGPKALWIMGSIFAANILLFLLFYKELKLVTFDAALAASLGFSPLLVHYGLMTMTSITAVGAFDSVGSILLVAFIIAPAATAYLLTNRLPLMVFLSAVFGLSAVFLGVWVANIYDVSIAGSMAAMCGLLFFVVFMVAPERGLISIFSRKRSQKKHFSSHMLLVHLLDHEHTDREVHENSSHHVHLHVHWTQAYTQRIVSYAKRKGYLSEEKGILLLTPLGRETARQIMTFS